MAEGAGFNVFGAESSYFAEKKVGTRGVGRFPVRGNFRIESGGGAISGCPA